MVQLRIYCSFRKAIRRLTLEEKGMLFDAMLAYAEDKTLLPLEGKADAIWDFVQEMLDAQHHAYENKCVGAEKARDKKNPLIDVDIKSNQGESTQVNLSNDMSCHDHIQDQIQDQIQEKKYYSQEKKRRKREFDQRSVTNDDFKDLFVDLDELEQKYIEEGKI